MRPYIDLVQKLYLTEGDEFLNIAKIAATPAFRTWFGSSKVVDGAGLPKVVFHGGKKGIEVFGSQYAEVFAWAERNRFKLSDIEKATYSNPAHFFTDDPRVADGYADQHSLDDQHVYEVFLRIERPLDLRPRVQGRDAVSKALSELLGHAAEFGDQTEREADRTISHMIRGVHHLLKGKSALMGHDGIIMPDTCVRDRSMHTSFVVFSSDQIKVVEAGFDASSPNIHH